MSEEGSEKHWIAREVVKVLLEDRASNLSFAELISEVAQRLRPFAPMWPFCWLKAVAILHEGSWRLTYFSLSGRWSERKPRQEIRGSPGEAVFITSRLIEADQAWKMLDELAQEFGTVQ